MSKLFYRYAAMSSGKSTQLLQVAHNYEERGMAVKLYTAAVDDRYGVGKVTSRLGVAREALTFDEGTVFDASVLGKGIACLLIDEAQFLSPQQAHALHRLAHEHKVPIMCYGLRSDFLGQAFAGSATLLVLADDIEEIKTICGCSRKASMNARIDAAGRRVQSGDQILIGGNSRYVAMCPDCFYGAGVQATTTV